jgi:NADH dehydrogenase FAD-containing subunit
MRQGDDRRIMPPAETARRTIAIIGGGFSGVVTAVHLLRGWTQRSAPGSSAI